MTLVDVETFRVTPEVLETTADILREAGKSGYERFVLWTGEIDGCKFVVQRVYVPPQRSFKGRDGLHVHVDADQLHELNTWLYDTHQVLGAQVHTHPHRAYHSETDDTYPIVTTIGGISIVVPDFAQDGVLTRGTAVYRLSGERWEELNRRRIATLLEVL